MRAKRKRQHRLGGARAQRFASKLVKLEPSKLVKVEQHEQLQVVADSLVSAHTVRPSNARKRQPKGEEHAASKDFDDEIPF